MHGSLFLCVSLDSIFITRTRAGSWEKYFMEFDSNKCQRGDRREKKRQKYRMCKARVCSKCALCFSHDYNALKCVADPRVCTYHKNGFCWAGSSFSSNCVAEWVGWENPVCWFSESKPCYCLRRVAPQITSGKARNSMLNKPYGEHHGNM